jgi:hypothetical protein
MFLDVELIDSESRMWYDWYDWYDQSYHHDITLAETCQELITHKPASRQCFDQTRQISRLTRH